MKKRCLALGLASVLLSFTSFAQKIVFADEFNTKNISAESAGGARIVEDSLTKEKVFIYTGKKEIIFYHLDASWKTLHKLSKDPNKESQFSETDFSVLRSSHDKDRWSFIVRSIHGYSKETVDFAAGTHSVDRKLIDDIAKNYREELFVDGSDTYILYLNKSNELNLTSFTSDLTTSTTRLDLSSALPVGKSKKYTAAELYNQVGNIDSIGMTSPYFTRRKVHFYVHPDKYSILISGDEPVVELNQYDKKTGKRIRSQLYSVEESMKGEKSCNTAALLFGNKVHVLAAAKNGGVYAVFDADTKKSVYQYAYNDKDKGPFNYGPVTYETLPGVTSTAVLKEKVEDITMDKFCSEMFRHSCAITARYIDGGNMLVTLANYDAKELAAATSTLRVGMNTMTSSMWYVSTSIGFIFDPVSLQVSPNKTTWNEINKSNASGSYSRVEPPASPDANAEYNDKKSYVIKTQFIGNRRYTIYFTVIGGKQLKIHEKILKVAPPKIFGLTD